MGRCQAPRFITPNFALWDEMKMANAIKAVWGKKTGLEKSIGGV
jgi:hypothetical protein